MLTSFIDTARQSTRININMEDIGTVRLPVILDSIQNKVNQLFDTAQYRVELTGTSITFLEGSSFIIKGLKQSIFWAFLLIAFCMLYLFKSLRILICSLVPNLIPLVITAGIMGYFGIPLKPSSILIFSIAMGISSDQTIYFITRYRHELKNSGKSISTIVSETIRETGVSMIYIATILFFGFGIFAASTFGGTQALGILLSITLLVSMISNLTLLPAFLLSMEKRRMGKEVKA